ncbi:hypothetical protein PVK06_048165 [Gossypium arboreum]|uniref:Uncharacterized protein n=1 Tax=Gossypium arboreum TaxID=29729 RepID=A0ABR0MFB0_GOSAR|nr:hypothetical protein PVK06_048165 [Gossypium arboreum]
MLSSWSGTRVDLGDQRVVILSESGSLIIYLSREMYGIKRALHDARQRRGPQLLSYCRRRVTKSVRGSDVMDESGLRVMVAGDRGLEWISPVRVLTIGLFSVDCFYHYL